MQQLDPLGSLGALDGIVSCVEAGRDRMYQDDLLPWDGPTGNTPRCCNEKTVVKHGVVH